MLRKVYMILLFFYWKWRFFKISSMHFCYFVISPLRKGLGPLIEQNCITFTQECFVSIFAYSLFYPLGKRGWFSGSGEDENVNSYRQKDNRTKDRSWNFSLKFCYWFYNVDVHIKRKPLTRAQIKQMNNNGNKFGKNVRCNTWIYRHLQHLK